MTKPYHVPTLTPIVDPDGVVLRPAHRADWVQSPDRERLVLVRAVPRPGRKYGARVGYVAIGRPVARAWRHAWLRAHCEHGDTKIVVAQIVGVTCEHSHGVDGGGTLGAACGGLGANGHGDGNKQDHDN
jgi:hypothetical protein